MTRTLPWLQSGSSGTAAKVKSTEAPQRSRLRTQEFDLYVDDNTTGVSTPQRRARPRPGRTPSTSPPPSPPRQEFMREGLAADDIWIMVEDEFLETAKLFTQHLHHAEYQRLKNLAKTRSISAINSTARPVDGRTAMSLQMKRKLEADAHSKAQMETAKKITNEADSDLDEEDDPWMKDPQLAGLMMNPRKPSTKLVSLTGVRANTRAAAGYPQARQTPRMSVPFDSAPQNDVPRLRARTLQDKQQLGDEDDDDDDLDALAYVKPRVNSEAMQLPKSTTEQGRSLQRALYPNSVPPHPKRPPSTCILSGVAQELAAPTTTRQSLVHTKQKHSAETSTTSHNRTSACVSRTARSKPASLFDDLPQRRETLFEHGDSWAQRKAAKAAKAKKEEQERRNSLRVEEIPTFLI
ncbi:hypothetical protein B0A49_06697 [Cryomyces minteri]|uniref:Uncharacterized protein n=1 Tax=Cryomyces minteri TaxID=331657 RepID=A0A4U0X6Z6_9PEZI|nr:hypothetical protein B0A49_06697 [Cryomyces minteri]